MITHSDRIVVLSILSSSNHTSSTVSPAQEDLPGDVGVHRRGGIPSPPYGISGDITGRTVNDMAPISPEFINYALALLVYSVRYSAVFWETNKSFSFLFSVQLVFSSLQSLLAFTGFSVFYKLNAYGLEVVLPNSDGFLLGRPFAIVLFICSCTIIGLSGSVVFFYGFRKFQAGVVREREKHHISWRESSRTLWGYLPHCLAFAVLVAVAFVTCPLMYDYTVIYKVSLDGAILSSVVGTIMYFFLWIVLWFSLTLKQRWHFRIHPGTSALCNGKLTKLPNDIELTKQKHVKNAPLIVISNGQTYTIKDLTPKKAILNVIHKSVQYHQQQQQQQHHHQRVKNIPAIGPSDEDDDIYWLKPKPPSPKQSPETEHLLWASKKKSSPSVKHKVTFEDTLVGGSPRKVRPNSNKSPKTGNKLKKQSVKFEDLTDTDEDGDYATLRDISLIKEVDEEHEDTLEKLLEGGSDDVENDDNDDKKSTQQHLPDEDVHSPSTNERGYEEVERICLLAKSPIHQMNVAVTVHDESPSPRINTINDKMSLQLVATEDERQEIATTRSNSLSSSCSPPDKGSSDTSSGIHSSSSVCDHHQSGRKSCSMDDLPKNINYYCPKPKSCWKSLSLQRTSSTSPFSSSGRGGAIAVYPKPGLDYVGYPPSIKDGRRDSTMVMLRNDKRPKTADLSQSRDPFGRDTNMRLTSFTDFTDPLSKCASSVVSSSITKQKIAPITIGILTSSPRHLPCTPDVVASRSTNSPHLPNLVPGVCKMANRQRDSANYSLTSSGESDNYLSHP